MADNNGMDINTHRKTFDSFWALSKWGTLICLVVAAIVVVIIAP